jgi:phosphotriesterase-related protein
VSSEVVRGPVVRTVTGDVPAGSLGPTLAHEHLIVDLSFRWDPSSHPEAAGGRVSLATLQLARRAQWALRDNLQLQDVELAVREVRPFVEAGGDAIVELSARGIGRDARALRYISERSGARIVAGTGEYVRGSHPPGLADRPVEALADEMVSEIAQGIGETGVRAGVIGEIGAGEVPMAPAERRVLVAAARASAATGAGIVVHPAPGPDSAFEVAAVLLDAGADPVRVCVAHLDDRFRGDLERFRRLAATGVRFGFDTFGREAYYRPRDRQHPSDAERIGALVRLVEEGMGDRIVLSQDLCMRIDLAAFGGTGYDHLLVGIVPRLRSAGLDAAAIDRMLIETPRSLLALPG